MVWNELVGLLGSGENSTCFSVAEHCAKNNWSDPAKVTGVKWGKNWPHMPEI